MHPYINSLYLSITVGLRPVSTAQLYSNNGNLTDNSLVKPILTLLNYNSLIFPVKKYNGYG